MRAIVPSILGQVLSGGNSHRAQIVKMMGNDSYI